MRINSNSTSGTSFGRIITGLSVKEALSDKSCPRSLVRRFTSLQRSLWNDNYAKKENVDIILNYSKPTGFYGVISSKKGEVPVKSDFYFSLESPYDKESFRKWVDKWNRVFASKS